MKKIPLRMCLITREKFEKRSLLRVVKTPEGQIVYDKTGKLNGKGAYLKKDIDIINKAEKSNAFNRLFECDIPASLYDTLRKEVENEKTE